MPASLQQHPFVDLRDEPDLLGHLEELAGRHEPAFGVLPAHQRLHPNELVVGQRHDGLVPHAELAALERAPQVSLEPQSTYRHVVQRGIEHRVPACAGVLGAVHRQVGVADDVLARSVRIGGHGHADAGSGKHVLPIERQRQFGHLLHAFGHPHRVERFPDAIEEHGEFIATKTRQRRLGDRRRAGHTRDHVVGPHGRGQPLGEHHEQAIAGGVPQAVVDVLEPVEVDKQHRELVVLAARPASKGAVQPFLEQGAIGQLRQVVVNGVVHQALARRAKAHAHGVERPGHGGGFCGASYRKLQ